MFYLFTQSVTIITPPWPLKRGLNIYKAEIQAYDKKYNTKIGVREQYHHHGKEVHMKKLSFLLATLSLAVVSLAGAGVAHAEATCDIGFTGPDSKNICTSETKFTCEIENNNTIVFKNENGQTAATGNATVSGNGEGGNATSGSATNENGATFTGTITNDNICVAVVTKPANVVPEAPVTPGRGQVEAAPVAQVTPGRGQAVVPTVLPDTSGVSPLIVTLVITGIAASVLAGTRLAIATYGRIN